TIEIKRAPHDAFFRDILRRQESSLLFNNNCGGANSYYFDRHGDAPFMRPASGLELWWHSRHFDLDDYSFARPRRPSRAPAKAAAAVAIAAGAVLGCSSTRSADVPPCALDVCGGECVDTSSDPAHCGACDRACTPAASCSVRACACPANFM